jgi:hypothetical protein
MRKSYRLDTTDALTYVSVLLSQSFSFGVVCHTSGVFVTVSASAPPPVAWDLDRSEYRPVSAERF